MAQKYKVFFNHNVVYLTNNTNGKNILLNHIINPDESEIQNIIKLFSTSKSRIEFHLVFDDLAAGWKLFKKQFKIKKAAGGLVTNSKNEFLFIKRKGFWDLPKGHMEKGETKKEAAIREVMEECGFKDLSLKRKIMTTYHTYYLNSELILKPSYWYLMAEKGNNELVPQTEEGITQVKWVTKNEIPELLEHSFSSISEVVDSFIY